MGIINMLFAGALFMTSIVMFVLFVGLLVLHPLSALIVAGVLYVPVRWAVRAWRSI